MVAPHRCQGRLRFAGVATAEGLSHFISSAPQDGGPHRIVVLKTKGDHLGGNEDTTVKRAMMDVLMNAYDWDHTRPTAQTELVAEDGTNLQCEMVRCRTS
jgi:hypothetical protein